MSLNSMAAVTVCCNFGAQEKGPAWERKQNHRAEVRNDKKRQWDCCAGVGEGRERMERKLGNWEEEKVPCLLG